MAVTTVGLVFRLTESAVRNFNRIDGAITSMEKAADKGTSTLRNFNKAMVAVGAAGTIGLGLASKNAANLEDALARLKTVTRSTSQTIETSLKNAEEAARSFATEYSASAAESIKAQFEIATAGVRVEEQIVAVQGAFLLAKATVGDFTQTAQLLGQFLNTFGKNVELGYLDPMAKVERITDVLASTVQRFQATLPVLAQGFKFIIGPAQQLNLRLEEVAVALGILNTAGFRGTLAGTALSNMFNKLQRAVDKLDLDPSQFQDLEGNLTSLAAFMREVNMALSDLSPLEGQIKLIEVFDIRAGRVIKTLANNADQLEKVSNELELASGATQQMADIMERTSSASLKQFLNALQNIATTIGKVINDSIRPLIRWMTDLTERVGALVSAFPGLTTGLLLIATGAALTSASIFAFNSVIKPAILFTLSWMKSLVGAIVVVAQFGAVILVATVRAAKFVLAQSASVIAVLATTNAIKTAIIVSSTYIARLVAMTIATLTNVKAMWAGVVATATYAKTLAAVAIAALANIVRIVFLSAILAAYTVAAASASSATIALTAAFIGFLEATVIGIVLFFVVKGVIKLVKWLWSLVEAVGAATGAVDKSSKGLRNIQLNFTDTASKARGLGAELDRLGKALQFGTRVSGDLSSSLGITKLAERIREIQKAASGGIKLDDAIRQAVSEIGESGIAREIAEKIFGPEFAEEAAKGFERSIAEFRKFDDSKKPLNFLRVFAIVSKEAAMANEIAVRSIIGDTQEVVDVFQKLSRLNIRIPALEAAGDKARTLLKTQEELAEGLVKSLNTLQGLEGFEQLAEDMFEFGLTAEASGEKFDKFMENFRTVGTESARIFALSQSILTSQNLVTDKATVKLKELISAYERYKSIINKVRTGTTRLDNSILELEKGIIPTSEAVKKATERFAFLEEQQKRVGAQSAVMADLIKVVRKEFEDLGQSIPKELEDIFKEQTFAPGKELKLGVDIQEKKIRAELATAFENITGFKIGSEIGKSIQSNSTQIAGILSDAVSGGITQGVAKAQLRNAFRQQFIDAVVTPFADAITSANAKALIALGANARKIAVNLGDELRNAAAANDFDSVFNLAFGSLNKLINGATDLKGVFESTTNEVSDLEKQLNKITVAGLSATDGQSSALDRLRRILEQDVSTIEAIERQNARLARFIETRADSGQGETVAVREAEKALERNLGLLSTGADKVISTLAEGASSATTVIQKAESSLVTTMAKVSNATTEIATILNPVFDKFLQGAELLKTLDIKAGDTILNAVVDFKSGELDIDITLTGSGATGDISEFLDEDEIRGIVEEVRVKLTEERDDKLRELEERLRGR